MSFVLLGAALVASTGSAPPASAAIAQAATTGAIHGTVTAYSGGHALSGICVKATHPGGSGSATTDAKGTYTISTLKPGKYTVTFSGCGSTAGYGYGTHAYATPVKVLGGATTKGINAVLTSTGGVISGTVTAATGGAKLAGICVVAQSLSGDVRATTASNGTYDVAGLVPASYSMSFAPGCGNSGNYLSNRPPGTVTVAAGSTAKHVNAAMVSGGRITGTVTAGSASGAKLAGICVDAYATGGYGTGTTTATGTYSIKGLTSATYFIDFTTGCGNTDKFGYQQFQQTGVTVTEGTTTPDVNVAMIAEGGISGTVTDSTNGAKLSGMCIYLSTGSNGPGGPNGSTIGNGTYAITGIAPGTYNVGINDGDYGCGNVSPYGYGAFTTTAAITVRAGKSTSLDAALVAGGGISGTVTSQATGQGIGGICVIISGGPRGEIWTTTNPSGGFNDDSNVAGNYTVAFSTTQPGGPPCGATGYADLTYPSTVVVSPDTNQVVNVVLAPG
jgi:hypothetical protein